MCAAVLYMYDGDRVARRLCGGCAVEGSLTYCDHKFTIKW